MVTHLVFEVLAGRAVGRTQVAGIGHVVEDLDGVDVELAQVIQRPPVHPARIVPLPEMRGLGNNRLEVKSQGSQYPRATNESTEGRRLNRRVEFVLTQID